MSIELFIKEEATKLGDKVYIAPDANPNYVLAIVDQFTSTSHFLDNGRLIHIRCSREQHWNSNALI